MIDGHAKGRADFVLPPIAPSDRSRLVVGGGEVARERLAHALRLFRLSALAQQRVDGNLYRRQPRIEPQHDSRLVLDHVLIVSVEHERQHRAIHARRRFDYPRTITRLRLFVEVGQVLAAELGVLIEVEAAAPRDSFKLAPAERIEIFHVGGAARVMRKFVLRMRTQPQTVARDAVLDVPVEALVDPVIEPALLLGRIGLDEEFHLHLLELARAKNEIAGRDLVAK